MVHSIAPVFENLNASNWYKAFLSACCAWVVSRSLQQCSVSCVTCISTVMPAKLLLIHYFFFFFESVFLFYLIYVSLCWVFITARGSSLLHGLFSLLCSDWGLLSGCNVRASHCGLLLLWSTGVIVPQHVGSSRTGDGTHVSCIGRRILHH